MNKYEYELQFTTPLLSLEDLKENSDLTPRESDEYLDNAAWENLIHLMPQKYLELLICMYLGLKKREISQVLGYKSVSVFINTRHDMRNYCKTKKVSLF